MKDLDAFSGVLSQKRYIKITSGMKIFFAIK